MLPENEFQILLEKKVDENFQERFGNGLDYKENMKIFDFHNFY